MFLSWDHLRCHLTVPGDFIRTYPAVYTHIQTSRATFTNYVNKFAHLSQYLATLQHGAVSTSVHRNLQRAMYVLICHDAYHTPLQRPYGGPFKIIHPGSKTFIVNIRGKNKLFQLTGSSVPAWICSSQLK